MLTSGAYLRPRVYRNTSKRSPDIHSSWHPVEGRRGERCTTHEGGKSWTDDPVHLGIVGAESGLCATIH